MVLDKLREIEKTFMSVEPQMRIEMLLDYSKKLPPVPAKYEGAIREGLNRVPECVTPVFLFEELDGDGRIHFHVAAAEEAPTVRGLMSIVVTGCNGELVEEVSKLPSNELERLGLDYCLGPQRTIGFSGIVERIRFRAARLAEGAGTQ